MANAKHMSKENELSNKRPCDYCARDSTYILDVHLMSETIPIAACDHDVLIAKIRQENILFFENMRERYTTRPTKTVFFGSNA